MRIFNPNTNEILDSIDIFLTQEELDDFIGMLENKSDPEIKYADAGNMIENEGKDGFKIKPLEFGFDFHVYSEKNFHDYTEGSKKIILEDKI